MSSSTIQILRSDSLNASLVRRLQRLEENDDGTLPNAVMIVERAIEMACQVSETTSHKRPRYEDDIPTGEYFLKDVGGIYR